jgi:hypothetical protein
MNNQTLSNSTEEKNLAPWSQPPTTIRIEDLTKEINEVKTKKNELARKEKELMIKFKDYVDQNGLDDYEDAEENRFSIGEVLIERRQVKRWTYSEAIKKLQDEEKDKEIAQQTESFIWIFNEAKK